MRKSFFICKPFFALFRREVELKFRIEGRRKDCGEIVDTSRECIVTWRIFGMHIALASA